MLVTNIMSDRNGNRKKWEEISSIAVIKTASLDGNGNKKKWKEMLLKAVIKTEHGIQKEMEMVKYRQ